MKKLKYGNTNTYFISGLLFDTITGEPTVILKVVVKMIHDYDLKKRYKITGEYDTENCVMYFDMATAEESIYRSTDKTE